MNTEIQFTRHATKSAARKTIHKAHNPCLVQLLGGGYDAFPLGHPLPAGAEIIERVEMRATGAVWREVETRKITARGSVG